MAVRYAQPGRPTANSRRGPLGKHRLLCGDATEPADYARLLGGTPADLLLTDPPYNVAYAGKTAAALTIANDDMTDEAYRAFLTKCLAAASAAL